MAEVDPLAPVNAGADGGAAGSEVAATAPSIDALDRLYRPQALDVPVLVARDGPIARIDPDVTGSLVTAPSALAAPAPVIEISEAPATPQVVDEGVPDVAILAVAPAWVRVTGADGTILLEKVLSPGERFVLPATEDAPRLRAGAAGSVFFEVGGEVFGPAGEAGSVASDVVLAADELRAAYVLADLDAEPELAAIVNVAEAGE